MTPVACTHCGHRFDAEKIEGTVCPSCGWATSIVAAADLGTASIKKQKTAPAPSQPGVVAGFIIFLIKVLATVLILVLLIWGIVHLVKARPSGPGGSVSDQKSISLKPVQSAPLKQVSQLTADEKAVLDSKLDLPITPQLADDELKQLQKAIDFTAGEVEKLPTGSWTLAEFKDYVAKKELFYKVPLPRSYKKGIEDLFQKTYATAYDLFLAGKIQQARDAYVAALGFPIYTNDLRKHRAVVLTMMRDFINDTIAKIGALNFTLARLQIKGQSEQVLAGYAALQQQIRAGAWSDALDALNKLEESLPDAQAAPPIVQAPPYGAGFEKVDADIKATLLRLLAVPTLGFDANLLRDDLNAKKGLLSKLADPDRKESLENYHAALLKIQTHAWGEALDLLKKVKSPAELKQDADQKSGILETLARDSGAVLVK